MASFGYGNIPARGFVSFERELDEAPWKEIATKKYEEAAKDDASTLLDAPQLVIFKLRLRFGIAQVIAALGATPLTKLDQSWDATQRRLFHRIAVHVDDDDPAMRACADRLFAQLLSGTGTAQTKLDYDDEVDFGRNQIALTREGGALAADVKKLKLGDVLAEVATTTEALAKGLGRAGGGARKAPSRKLRDAVAECAAAFNAVHEGLSWFTARTPPGPDRDQLVALQAPLDRLLERHASVAVAPAAGGEEEPADKPEEEPEKEPEEKPG